MHYGDDNHRQFCSPAIQVDSIFCDVIICMNLGDSIEEMYTAVVMVTLSWSAH